MRLRPFVRCQSFSDRLCSRRFCCTDACHSEIDGVFEEWCTEMHCFIYVDSSGVEILAVNLGWETSEVIYPMMSCLKT